jgi:hypothetical protein
MLRAVAFGLSSAAALAVAGCGGGGKAVQNETGPPSTTSAGDRGAVERRLVRYFERNLKTLRWYSDVRRFEIKGGTPVPRYEAIKNGTVVVHTRLDAQDRRAARQICLGVFGADVADEGGTVRVLTEAGERVAQFGRTGRLLTAPCGDAGFGDSP